jgi:DNA-binding transcriptional MerR regulator
MAKDPKKRAVGPAWRPGDPTMTVGEIAARLAPIAPDTEATIQKIRHWAREGIMAPVAQAHEGTGKHRLYAADDLYTSAILYVLTSFGLTITALRPLVDCLTVARSALPKWKKQRGPLYFKVWRRWPSRGSFWAAERGSFWVDAEPPAFKDLKHPIVEQESQPAELLLAIDLNELWGLISP